ncbi:MAG: nuclear transport factor 2 family protein [Maribacter sp.]|nr:nuclear transport factor 2 family protein [Maribacter sp.]
MKITKLVIKALLVTLLLMSCNSKQEGKSVTIPDYEPDDQLLYDAIVAMDKAYFDAYNSCDLKTQTALYSEDIEFYHDQGGVMTVKEDIIDAIEKNICGRVTRELVEGSIEVYPIKDYGAVQMGYHKFHNNQEPNAPANPSKFIMLWQNENNAWKITKVISLH